MSEPKTVPGFLELFLNIKDYVNILDPIEINTLMNSEKHQNEKIKFHSETAREIFINDKKHWDEYIYDTQYYYVISSLKSKVYEEVRKSGCELTNWWSNEAYLSSKLKKIPTYDHYNNPRMFAHLLWKNDEHFKKIVYDSELFFEVFKKLRKVVCITNEQNEKVKLNKNTLQTGYELYEGITSNWHFKGKNNQYDGINEFPSPLIQEIQKTIPFLYEEMLKPCMDMDINNCK